MTKAQKDKAGYELALINTLIQQANRGGADRQAVINACSYVLEKLEPAIKRKDGK